MRVCSLSFIFLLIFLQVSGIKSVLAQDTPTPPNEPLYKTPTPRPTENTNCPGVNPVGWGSVTPDPYWLGKCYACITRTPYYDWPTLTPAPWDTPQATYTPAVSTATVTPSVSLPNVIRYGAIESVYQNEIYNPSGNLSYSPGTSKGLIFYNTAPAGTFTKIGIAYHQHTYLRFQSGGWLNRYYIAIVNKGQSNFLLTVDGGTPVSVNPNGTIYYIVPMTSYSVNTTIIRDWEFEVQYTNVDYSGGDFEIWFFGQSAKDAPYGTYNDQWLWQWGGLTPLPTATPTPYGGYCGQVPQPVDDPDLPIPWVGWPRCIQFGGWSFNIEWFNNAFSTGWENILQVPGMQICFRPLYMGDLNILGLIIDIDFIMGVMAAVLLFRLITRS